MNSIAAYCMDHLFGGFISKRMMSGGWRSKLLGRQHRITLQRLRDLTVLEEQASREGRDDLLLLFRGAVLHTEADLKWIEACRDELAHREGG